MKRTTAIILVLAIGMLGLVGAVASPWGARIHIPSAVLSALGVTPRFPTQVAEGLLRANASGIADPLALQQVMSVDFSGNEALVQILAGSFRNEWISFLFAKGLLNFVPNPDAAPWAALALTDTGNTLKALVQRGAPEFSMHDMAFSGIECWDQNPDKFCAANVTAAISISDDFGRLLGSAWKHTVGGRVVLVRRPAVGYWQVQRETLRESTYSSLSSLKSEVLAFPAFRQSYLQALFAATQRKAYDVIFERVSTLAHATEYNTVILAKSGLEFMRTPLRGTSIQQLIRECAASALGGYSDWRMPTLQEFAKIFVNEQIDACGDNHMYGECGGGFVIDSPDRRIWQQAFLRIEDRKSCSYASCEIENSYIVDTFCVLSDRGNQCVRADGVPETVVMHLFSENGPFYYPVTVQVGPHGAYHVGDAFRFINQYMFRDPISKKELTEEFPERIAARVLCVRNTSPASGHNQ